MAALLRTIVPASAMAPPNKHQRALTAALSVKPRPHQASFNSPVHFPQRMDRRSRSPPLAATVSGRPDTVTTEGFASLLEGVEVFDLEGEPTPLLDLWKDRKAVVGFARHFGCVFCRKRADLLASKKDLMDAAGVALAIIGPGSVEQAKAFYEQTNFKGDGSVCVWELQHRFRAQAYWHNMSAVGVVLHHRAMLAAQAGSESIVERGGGGAATIGGAGPPLLSVVRQPPGQLTFPYTIFDKKKGRWSKPHIVTC